jgi:hypothetical protein
MEPDAIRPDRDKTGRQKNPRRNTTSMCSSKTYGDVDIEDRTSPIPCASTASSPSDEDFTLRSYCESTAPSATAVHQKNLIVNTLSEIETICTAFLDDPKTLPIDANEQVRDLTDMITRTTLICQRTPVIQRFLVITFHHYSWTTVAEFR